MELFENSEGGARGGSNAKQFFMVVVIIVYQVCFGIGKSFYRLQVFYIKNHKTLYNVIIYFLYYLKYKPLIH